MGSFNYCVNSQHDFSQISKTSSLLKLVGEESRLKILFILKQGEHCVCEIEKHVDLSQSLISHHLKDLKEAGLLDDEKRGLFVYYSLTKKGKEVTDLLFQIQ